MLVFVQPRFPSGIVTRVKAAARAGHEYSVPSFSSLDSAIRRWPDALIIATPTTTHLEVLKTAIQSKLHALIEKPIMILKRQKRF